jgi:3-oxoacyl-[acyl-carrier protein] reductase
MSDFLLELGKNPTARNIVKSLGLPIPIPQDLLRTMDPAVERPLADRDVALCLHGESRVLAPLAHTVLEAGGNPYVVGDSDVLAHFRSPGEAFGRVVTKLDLAGGAEGAGFDALVMDATGIASPEELSLLHEFFQPLVSKLRRCGRLVVIGRPDEEMDTPAGSAAQASLIGFVRSVAKEVGRKGATAQLLLLSRGAEPWLAGPIRFLLSRRSAYLSGQVLRVGATGAAAIEPAWVQPLERKVALVTGAARGIGAATVRTLAKEGAKVICLDRPSDDGPTSQLAREVDGAIFLKDITDPDCPEALAHYLRTEFGGVDIVVHNAGITRDKTLGRMSGELWEQAVDVNLAAVVRINDVLLDGVVRDGGRVICLSSVAGIAGNAGQTNYAASKAGIIGYVKALAKQSAAHDITVNAIAPGFIETRLTDAIPVGIREVGRRLNNLGQGGVPVDIGHAITFIASPGSQGITGQVVRVCGGCYLGA